jgi:ribonuclease E
LNGERESARTRDETQAPQRHEPRRVDDAPPAQDLPVSRARARAASLATSSEPRIERVVVAPDKADATVAEEASAPAGPTRKGWWQKKLGGE